MHPSHPTDLAVRFERQREAFARDPAPLLATRISRLAEQFVVRSGIRHARMHALTRIA
jgi:coniferyl-aldehyde dehydrogenase